MVVTQKNVRPVSIEKAFGSFTYLVRATDQSGNEVEDGINTRWHAGEIAYKMLRNGYTNVEGLTWDKTVGKYVSDESFVKDALARHQPVQKVVNQEAITAAKNLSALMHEWAKAAAKSQTTDEHMNIVKRQMADFLTSAGDTSFYLGEGEGDASVE